MTVRSQGVCRGVAANHPLDRVHYHLTLKLQNCGPEYTLNFAGG